ncbi:MAG: PQQ-binding-like beta-propeller repeat protein [Gemmataceae bacterium]|nr:PQQ-binding-like beta-propeller repeat protein [Gemmataceae bacterium]
MSHRTIVGILVGLLLPIIAAAEEWPGWRGPRGDGTSAENGIPTKWSASENVAWKTAIPGKGHSSPSIWGDRVFVTTADEKAGKHTLLCLDRKDGKVLWERTQDGKFQKAIHKLNSHASSTPATDGKNVFVSFHDIPNFVVCCYDFDGKLIWKKSPGEFHSVHGFCSSPLLYKDMVILNGDQDAPKGKEKGTFLYDSYVVALDKATGAERWRTKRPHNIRSYTPPVLIDVAGKKQVVFSGSLNVASYDPDTGKQIWIVDNGPTEQFVSSLVYANGLVFMTYGFPKKGYAAIKPDGTGDVSATHVAYNFVRDGGYVPSPIAHGDYFYFVNDEGLASCVEAKTGKSQWKERLGKHHSASPVSSGEHLYFPDDYGVTWVLKAGPKFEVVQKNDLGEEVYASPAISRGQLFLRTNKGLYCIGSAVNDGK